MLCDADINIDTDDPRLPLNPSPRVYLSLPHTLSSRLSPSRLW